MTIGELESKLSEYPLYYTVAINYPNDDQDWDAEITVWDGNTCVANIVVPGD